MKKTLAYILSFFTLVFLTGFFSRYLGRMLGAMPEFFLVFLVSSAIFEGMYYGIIFGFVAGLAADFTSVFLPGANCIIYTTIGYVIGSLKGKFYASSIRNQVILVVSASLFNKISLVLAGETFGVRYGFTFKWLVLTVFYDVVFASFVFYIWEKISSLTEVR